MGLGAYVAVSAALFALGIIAILARRNVIYILMGIEMILNAANLNFVAFNRFGSLQLDGQMFAIFTIILAAAERASRARSRSRMFVLLGVALYVLLLCWELKKLT